MKPGRLVVVSGPSGVGKGSVISAVRKRCQNIWLSVSTTTRAPRPGEVEGQDYFFVTQDWFAEAAREGQFLEWATYADNSYGTAAAPVQAQLQSGVPVVLEIDLAGARQIRAARPDAVMVLIAPPSQAELEARLRGRGTEDAAALERRLAAAEVELAASNEFDHVLVNDEIAGCADKLIQLIDCRPC